ncbi:MAG: hypothetical protein HOV94_36690 [Saccharothrix sp.]|nr:hypothetical protein [Saccharothrix sp.]
MVDPTDIPPSSDALPGVGAAETKLRAARIKPITFGQFKAIRQAAIELGLPAEVASTMPWLAADPQVMVAALRGASSHPDLLARGVVGIAVQIDAMTSMILRSMENLRAEEHRYRGTFTLPRYTADTANSALRADLSAQPSVAQAWSRVESELKVVDQLINDTSPYGEDIRVNGIQRGGVLFPLVIDLPGDQRIGGFDSTDSYSRTLFAQHHSGITVTDVLEAWHTFPPSTAAQFNKHPMLSYRKTLLSITSRILQDGEVTESERSTVFRAVMPKTRLVLKVLDSGDLGIDEVRRRLVSEQHLDKQLEFTSDTANETRAEAVLVELARKDLIPELEDGFTAAQVVELLEEPRKVVGSGERYSDDVAVAAASVYLAEPGSMADRAIFPAIATRGVITAAARRKWLRSNLATQVIMRLVTADVDQRDLRRSALERALRSRKLRGAELDARSIPELRTAALAELKEFTKARARGESADWGPAMKQIALRGLFHLTCGRTLALNRSPVGGKADQDDNREPTQIIEGLVEVEAGLEQLTQAILDGRNGVHVRKLVVGESARDISGEPGEGDVLDDKSLRKWLTAAADKADAGRKGEVAKDAKALVARDAIRLRDATITVTNLVERIGEHADQVDESKKPRPYVRIHGTPDTHKLGPQLSAAAAAVVKWDTVFSAVSGTDLEDGLA